MRFSADIGREKESDPRLKKTVIVLCIISFLLVSGLSVLGISTWRLLEESKVQSSSLKDLKDRNEQMLADLQNLEGELQTRIEELEASLSAAGQDQTAMESQINQGMEKIQEIYFDLLKKNDGTDAIWKSNIPGKVAYLTFDDGPSRHTAEVLSILRREKIKASFFVNGRPNYENLYARILAEGHALGIHGYSHDYETIYKSVDDFIADVDKLEAYLGGLKINYNRIYRFPGGAKNTIALRLGGPDLTARISAAMAERGYHFYEWNVSGDDAESKPDGSLATKDEIVRSVLREARYKRIAVVLLHDGPGHAEMIKALPEIIQGLKKFGYSFRVLP